MQGETNIISRGLAGVTSTSAGFFISKLDQVEAWLRIASLFVGIAVGVISFVSILRKMQRKKSERKHQI